MAILVAALHKCERGLTRERFTQLARIWWWRAAMARTHREATDRQGQGFVEPHLDRPTSLKRSRWLEVIRTDRTRFKTEAWK